MKFLKIALIVKIVLTILTAIVIGYVVYTFGAVI